MGRRERRALFGSATALRCGARAPRCRSLKLTKTAWLLLIGLWVGLLGCSEQPAAERAERPPAKPAAAYAGTIVAVGDSLTAGLGVLEEQAYPAQLERRLQADGHRYRVVNAGVSGETSSGTLSRIEWVLASLTPDIVILETGANDGLRGLRLDLLETNLDRLVGLLRAEKVEVILAGMQMLPNLGPDYTRTFAAIYPKIAAKHGIALIPFFLEGVAGIDRLNQADNLHPTAEGYTRIVETIYPFVIDAIRHHQTR